MNTLPLAGKKVCIDPGHGGKYIGAVGPAGTREKDINLDVSLQLRDDLVELGAEVRMTRTTDAEVVPGGTYSQDLQGRCDIANRWPADLFVSVHTNSNTKPSVHGTECYHTRNASPKSRVLSRLIHQRMVDELALKDNGVRQADFYVIKHTRMPGVLVETAYVSNVNEEQRLRDPQFRIEAGHSIARGIKDYFAIEDQISDGPPAPPTPDRIEDLLAPGDPEEYLLAGAHR